MAGGNRERDKLRALGEEIGSGSVDSILASLFMKIIKDLHLDSTMRFNQLMERFLSDPRNGYPQNIKERSSARGNLRKELMRNVQTWKVFCKGLRFINVNRFKIIVELHHANGEITSHGKQVVLREYDAEDAPTYTRIPP